MKIQEMLQYGVIALLDVASNQSKAPVSSFAISERQGITSNVLEKIMRNLRISGIIEAVRGPKGGYTIARPIDEISLLDIFNYLGNTKPQVNSYTIRYKPKDSSGLHSVN